MEKYEPTYLGKVMPNPDNPSKLTSFLSNKYDAFTKVYDACKDHSNEISSIESVDEDNDAALNVKIITDSDTLNKIQESSADDPTVTVSDTGIIGVTI